MTTTTHAPTTTPVLSKHCAALGPFDSRPATHQWCTGCTCPCHPRRLMRARLTSHVFTHHVHIDVALVLALADVLIHRGFAPDRVEAVIVSMLDGGWTPPGPS